MEVTPKVRRKFSYNAGNGKKYDTIDASSTTRSTAVKVRQEREPKARIEETKDRGKIPIYQRLGRQFHHDAEVSNLAEFDTEMVSGNRRILVSRISSSAEDNGLPSKSRSVRARIGKTVKLSKTDQDASSERVVSKSHRSAKVSVKRIPKKPASSPNEESVLEKKIQRIKQQNGKILKRQMEIQREKEKFG